MSYGLHEIDHKKLAGYEKSIEADKLLAKGLIDEARIMMTDAASADKTYSVRAELIGRQDSRKIRVSTTVRQIIIPFLTEAGFNVTEGGKWAEGKFLRRTKDNVINSILIGRDKFGNRLGIMVAQYQDQSKVEYFDWCTIGIRSGTLAYKTQEELEAVCKRWCDLITLYVFPWFDGKESVK